MFRLEDIESYEYVHVKDIYDIEVEDNHNYFIDVGKEVLVHNSTKTYSILQLFYILALKSNRKLIFSVVSESVPHLRRGALRDWMEILGEDYDPEAHNKTDEVFKIGESIVEFFAVDHPDKARGGRRDHLFINECNRIPSKMRSQLKLRTRGLEFLDYNPSSEFWTSELIADTNKVWFDISTYKDAMDLNGKWLIPQSTIDEIEGLRLTNPNWWTIYGLGQLGNIEGLIMPAFELVDALPNGLDTTCGLDFGFSNDPSAFLEAGERGGALWVNQLFYGRGMTNQDIVRKMKMLKVPATYLIFADNAEPKSIQEIYEGGFRGIQPCSKHVKGEGRFNYCINKIRQYPKIFVTKKSVDVIKDFRNAMWAEAITGEYLNKPMRPFLHSVHALIYSLSDRIGLSGKTEWS